MAPPTVPPAHLRRLLDRALSRCGGVALSCLFLALAVGLASAEPSAVDLQCRRNMNLIGEALALYATEHNGEYPRRLSDLVDTGYLSDGRALKCPVAMMKHDPTIGIPGFADPSETDPRTIGYGWELSPDSQLNPARFRSVTFKELKLRQLETPVRDRVPLVRCQYHNDCYNLTVENRLYRSPKYWEETIIDRYPPAYLSAANVLDGQPPLRERIAERPDTLPQTLIDLAPWAYGRLWDPWRDGTNHDEVFGFEKALQDEVLFSVGDIMFDARCMVMVCGRGRSAEETMGFRTPKHPKAVRGISIGQPARRVHVLATLHYPPLSAGEEVAALEFRSAEGAVIARMPWRHGKEIAWMRYPMDENPEYDLTDGVSRVVWNGTSQHSINDKERIRVFAWSWENPQPEETVATVDFVAGDTSSIVMLMGLTVAPPGSE